MLRETDPQTTIWELLLPEEVKRLPAELAHVEAYLDDERFIAPWRGLFSARLGRPSVPIDTLLRLLYLKHRYQLGYESLCREVADSISWRRFYRIPLDRPVPHPTTLVKLVRRAGPDVIEQLNAALLAKLTADKLLRARKLRVDTTVVEADIDYPTDADPAGACRAQAGRAGAAHQGLRCRQQHPVPGPGPGRRSADEATGPYAAPAHWGGDGRGRPADGRGRRSRAVHPGQVQVVAANARRALGRRPDDGRLARLVGELAETITHTGRLLAQTDQRLAGDRVIPDRLVSLADPDTRPIRKGKPSTRPSSATPCCWPRTNAGSSPTTSCRGATHPTPRS